MSLDFLVTAFLVVLVPGTGVVYTLAVSLARGWTLGVVAAAGCTLGIVPHLSLSLAGGAALLRAHPLLYDAFTVAGAGFLLYLAWGLARARGSPQAREADRRAGAGRIVRDGILLNLLNPKLSVFFLAFLPAFVPDGAARPEATLLALSLVFMAMTFAVFVAYGGLAAALRARVLERPRAMLWVNRGFAACFVLLAARLLASA
jgi:threonine/homoserine/homoserine lactone efflux protein